MKSQENKFYLIILSAIFCGYLWLILAGSKEVTTNMCPVKLLTNIPCPSCGSTRSVLFLMHGNLKNAIKMNPLGIIIALIMTCVPLWIIYDLITRKKSFLSFYKDSEAFLRKPAVAIPAILLILLNWIWNISKGI